MGTYNNTIPFKYLMGFVDENGIDEDQDLLADRQERAICYMNTSFEIWKQRCRVRYVELEVQDAGTDGINEEEIEEDEDQEEGQDEAEEEGNEGEVDV